MIDDGRTERECSKLERTTKVDVATSDRAAAGTDILVWISGLVVHSTNRTSLKPAAPRNAPYLLYRRRVGAVMIARPYNCNTRQKEKTISTADGVRDNILCSNSKVKSKLSLHPICVVSRGRKLSSFPGRHTPEAFIAARLARIQIVYSPAERRKSNRAV